MLTIKKRPATTAVPFPRAINPGINSVKVNFEDFSLEVRDVETMGPVEIIYQKANPKVALQVVHTKDLGDFDNMLGKAMGMHVTSQYITGDYSFFVLFSGIQGDFAKSETDLHVRMHRLFDAIRGGASWYQKWHGMYDDSNCYKGKAKSDYEDGYEFGYQDGYEAEHSDREPKDR